jgi:hypothetical protein
MKPHFKSGRNIAIKVPPEQFDQTVFFYRDILGYKQITISSPNPCDSVTFEYGDNQLWIDKVSSLSQAEIWLEIITDNIDQAVQYFENHKVVRRDEIESLPDDFKGFWISSPSNIIHLVSE